MGRREVWGLRAEKREGGTLKEKGIRRGQKRHFYPSGYSDLWDCETMRTGRLPGFMAAQEAVSK